MKCYNLVMNNLSNESYILLGCKHCGKSTQGKMLSQKLNLPFFDTDTVMEEICKTSVRELYAKKGPSAFMEVEEQACKMIAKENANKQIVVATGGGICDNAPALTFLRELGTFVFLRLDIDYSISRIMNKVKIDGDGIFYNVPAYVMVKNPKTIDDIRNILFEKYKERFEQYASISDVVVDIKNGPVDQNFTDICQALQIK